jgi:AraC family transcriptional regulator, arabinose operon regulatory protein
MEKSIKTYPPSPRKKEGFEGQRACILPQSLRNLSIKHRFCRHLYITDIGYYPHATYHNRERKKGCRQYVLIYCVKGRGWYIQDDRKYEVVANQFFVLPEGRYHQYAADIADPWSIYWVHFTGQQAGFYYDYLDRKKKGPISTAPSSHRLLILDDIMDHLELMHDEDNLVYSNSQLYGVLSGFREAEVRKKHTDNRQVQQIIALMKNNLHRNFSLAELAGYVHLSVAHFSALFKEKTKYSPLSLYTSLKMQQACHLLMDSGYNIKTIASQLGYDDPYHFSRVFKKIMGVSPRGFRKKDA